MLSQDQPDDRINQQAICDLARARISGRISRAVFYALGTAISVVFVPAFWVALFLGLIIAAEFVEYRMARALLTGTGSDIGATGGVTGGATGSRRARALAAAHIATAIAVALALAAIWAFTGPSAKAFPLCLLAIAALDAIQTGHQVMSLIMMRQAIYMGAGVGMTQRDILQSDWITLQSMGAGPLPVLLLSVAVLSVSYARAQGYHAKLRHRHQLADSCEAATRADDGKSHFIATISHELRTPLNGVLGMAQTLLKTELTSVQRQQAEVILDSGHTLNTLLNDLLDYTKLEAGKLAIEPPREDLRLTAEHVAQLYSGLASDKGIALQFTVDPDVPQQLLFDAVRVRQCLSNLVSNAVKFTEAGSVQMTISGKACDPDPDGLPHYLITAVVADTGIGIPADRQAHLFQPFSQADGSITRRFGGTGLGLCITRQLAESMGGTVTLQSTPGEGSVFRLTFAAGKSGAAGDGQNPVDAPSRA